MATKQFLNIDQGSTFSTNIPLTDGNNNPINLNGLTGFGQIKSWYTSNTSANLVVSFSNNIISISLDAPTSANMESGKYVYDIIGIDGSNNVTRVLEGYVMINPAVTNETANVNL